MKPILTTKELAERWSMAEITLSTWRLKGTGPSYVKLGRRVVYRIEDIEDWEKLNIKRSTAE